MRFVLFDIDGTLIRGDGTGREAMEEAFADVFSLPEIPRFRQRVRFNGAIDPEIFAAAATVIGVRPEDLAARWDALSDCYLQYLGDKCRQRPGWLLPGVSDLLALLERLDGVAIGLLTGNIERSARVKLEPHGLNPYFVTGGYGDNGSSREQIAQVARQRMEEHSGTTVPPSQVTVVGDSCRDIQCGKANGFMTLAVATGWTCREELLAAQPDHLVEDLSSVETILAYLQLPQAAVE